MLLVPTADVQKNSSTPPDSLKALNIARKHLKRVLTAWPEPDWSDLTIYGFYCLESAVVAAAAASDIEVKWNHSSKAEAAQILAERYDIPDVSGLIKTLNIARKSIAYGNLDSPELIAEDIATEIEEYVNAVENLTTPDD